MAAIQAQELQTVPTPGRWQLDPAHSTVGFWAKHLGLSRVRGRFNAFSAEIEIGERPEDLRAEATIDAASIETKTDMRDDHLRSPDFLDVDRFKEIRFVGRSLKPGGEGTWKLDGDLTIRDVTRPVSLDVEFTGEVDDPMAGTRRAGFSGSTLINREDFDMTWNGAIEIGGLVGKKVHIEIEAEALLQKEGEE
jgi:polyisoprenoid-binding protein YceI